MKQQLLASEAFSARNRHYFLDFKRAVNDSNYIQITRSEQQPDGSFKRWQLIVFEDDFANFIQAFSSLFLSAAWGGSGYKELRAIHAEAKITKGMKDMPPEERPREKLLNEGRGKMADRELLAMLIGSGTPNESALELAGRILASIGNDLQRLRKITSEELCTFSGMGMAKSCSVIAALELADRIAAGRADKVQTIYVLKKTGWGKHNSLG